jgi:hypothetical protein
MDPLVWATIAEFWWTAPATVGAGALGWVGLRRQRAARHRRLALDAARLDLQTARRASVTARGEARVARAELVRIQAERSASRATSADVAAARRRAQQSQRDAKAASAAVRSARARLSVERAARPTAATPIEELPLARVKATHDAVTARWMEYETDAARVIAFPAMTDARHPLISAHLTARAEAQRLRPQGTRVTAAEFVAYRDAVHRLDDAFAAAESHAWREARARGTAPAGETAPPSSGSPGPRRIDADRWGDLAQQALAWSTDSLVRATEAAAAAFTSRVDPAPPNDAGRDRAAPSRSTDRAGGPDEDDPPADGPPQADTPRDDTPRWPVPRRS